MSMPGGRGSTAFEAATSAPGGASASESLEELLKLLLLDELLWDRFLLRASPAKSKKYLPAVNGNFYADIRFVAT
jgi:hypothetical protein